MRISSMACGMAAVVLAGSASANLLVNESFESDITFDGAPFVGSWEGFSNGPGVGTSTDNPRTGAQNLDLFIDDTPNAFAGAFQEVAGVAGEEYTFSIWAADLLGGNGAGVELRLEFVDATAAEVGRTGNFVPSSLGSQYELLSVSGIAPAGTAGVRGVLAIQSFGGPATQQVVFDDASVVPEPATAALLGLGGLAMLRRRG